MRRASGLVLAPVLALAGCGGGSDAGSTSTRASHAGSTNSAPPARATSSQSSKQTASTTTTTGGGPTPAPSKLSPTATVEAVLEGRPLKGACGSLVTSRYLKTAFGGTSNCTASIRSGGSAKSVRIVSTQPSGKYAAVVVVPSGGPSSGERLTVSLVKGPRGWQLDAIHSNVKVGP